MSDNELEQLEQWLDEAGTRMIDGTGAYGKTSSQRERT